MDQQHTATNRVLAIPELLEAILLQCGNSTDSSWKQLFVLKRVSSTFDAVIQQSPMIRRAMHLERRSSLSVPRRALPPPPSDNTITSDPKRPLLLEGYRKFFYNFESLLYPFWCHLRISPGPDSTLILALNVSLFWSEEVPGVASGRAPSTLDGSTPVEKPNSWRNILVPYHPDYPVQVQCCGSRIIDVCGSHSTLGDLADEAIRAGRGHLSGVKQVIYHG